MRSRHVVTLIEIGHSLHIQGFFPVHHTFQDIDQVFQKCSGLGVLPLGKILFCCFVFVFRIRAFQHLVVLSARS